MEKNGVKSENNITESESDVTESEYDSSEIENYDSEKENNDNAIVGEEEKKEKDGEGSNEEKNEFKNIELRKGNKVSKINNNSLLSSNSFSGSFNIFIKTLDLYQSVSFLNTINYFLLIKFGNDVKKSKLISNSDSLIFNQSFLLFCFIFFNFCLFYIY
jgi:hypothetical protein